jgi:outer membrane protein TolC
MMLLKDRFKRDEGEVGFFQWVLPVGRLVGVLMLGLLSNGYSEELNAVEMSEDPVVPVDLLLSEDLFPQLLPVLRHAAQQSPGVLARNVDLAVAEANEIIAFSERYPSVAGTLRYDYRREEGGALSDAQNKNVLLYLLQARYPLYHWGAIEAASEIGKIGVEIAEGQLETAYRKLIQSIRSQYLGLVLRKMQLQNSTLDLERQSIALEFETERLEAGEIAPNRVGSASLSLKEAELRHERAASDYYYLFRQFQRLVGDTDLSDDVIADHIPEVGHNPDHLSDLLSKFVNGGFDDDPRVKAAALQVEREEQVYRIQHVRNRPKLDLTAGVTQDALSYTTSAGNRDGATALFAGISVRWSIFDGFETRGLKRASLLRLNRLRRDLRELDTQLKDDANQAADKVRFSARALEYGEIRHKGAVVQLQIAKADFEKGLASEESVESAKSRVRQVGVDVARLRVEYLNAVSSFLSLVGADEVVDGFADHRPVLGPEYEQRP